MKNKFTTIILFLLMIFLIAAIVIFAGAIYLDITKTSTTDVIHAINAISADFEKNNTIKNTTVNSNTYSDTTLEEVDVKTANSEIGEKYFYSQLDETQRKIYDGLQANKEQMRDGKYEVQYGGIFSEVLEQEGGNEKLGNDYQSAVEAFLYDHPDVFYIDANKLYLNVETTNKIIKKTYNVYIGPVENSTYYVNGFETEKQVNDAIERMEKIKDNILSKMTGNKYRDILKIHDYLIENIEYDTDYSSIGTYSIYGAFIDKKCVCEGYSKALKYLLNVAGIPCEIVQGTATSSSGKTESHAWNCVYLDGKWYYIDATWNDPIIIGNGTVAKSIQYKYFLKGSKTMDKDHVLSYQFSDEGKIFKYPTVSKEDYK